MTTPDEHTKQTLSNLHPHGRLVRSALSSEYRDLAYECAGRERAA